MGPPLAAVVAVVSVSRVLGGPRPAPVAARTPVAMPSTRRTPATATSAIRPPRRFGGVEGWAMGVGGGGDSGCCGACGAVRAGIVAGDDVGGAGRGQATVSFGLPAQVRALDPAHLDVEAAILVAGLVDVDDV